MSNYLLRNTTIELDFSSWPSEDGNGYTVSNQTVTLTSKDTVYNITGLPDELTSRTQFIVIGARYITLNGNKLFTQLSNSDIDIDPSGTGTVNLRVPTQGTVGSAGGASNVPASPTTYLKIKVNGTEYVIPAFAVS